MEKKLMYGIFHLKKKTPRTMANTLLAGGSHYLVRLSQASLLKTSRLDKKCSRCQHITCGSVPEVGQHMQNTRVRYIHLGTVSATISLHKRSRLLLIFPISHLLCSKMFAEFTFNPMITFICVFFR